MNVDFGMSADAFHFIGFTRGMITRASTTQHMGAVMNYVSNALVGAFELAMDSYAALNPEQFHHVYEWGKSYGSHETVGVPQFRLWKLMIVGTGRERGVSYTFLPSKRPVPIEEELLVPGKRGKTVLTDVHIFTWKATVMEYGLPVSISPKLGNFLVFPDPQSGKLVFTRRTINTVPGKDKLRGNFHSFFQAWWTGVANTVFDRQIRPELEATIIPRDARGRFVKRTSASQRSFGSKETIAMMIRTMAAAEAEGEAVMRASEIDYVARAKRRRMDLYGY